MVASGGGPRDEGVVVDGREIAEEEIVDGLQDGMKMGWEKGWEDAFSTKKIEGLAV